MQDARASICAAARCSFSEAVGTATSAVPPVETLVCAPHVVLSLAYYFCERHF